MKTIMAFLRCLWGTIRDALADARRMQDFADEADRVSENLQQSAATLNRSGEELARGDEA